MLDAMLAKASDSKGEVIRTDLECCTVQQMKWDLDINLMQGTK